MMVAVSLDAVPQVVLHAELHRPSPRPPDVVQQCVAASEAAPPRLVSADQNGWLFQHVYRARLQEVNPHEAESRLPILRHTLRRHEDIHVAYAVVVGGEAAMPMAMIPVAHGLGN